MDVIRIKRACMNNLKGFDIDIPKNKIIVATGVSGSGKSSLMFDIIFEEGRNEYLQSLGMLSDLEDEKKYDEILGIGPAIAVKQSVVRQSNPKSTVGSRTNILRMLGLLYSSEGKMNCPECDNPVKPGKACSECGNEEEALDVGYFSYNNANGMCMECSGRGVYYKVNMDKLVENDEITVRQIFRNAGVTSGFERVLANNLKEYMDMPYTKLPEEIKEEVINGHYTNSKSGNQSYCLSRLLQGRLSRGEYLGDLYKMITCPECSGYRIGEEAREVYINEKHIGEIGKMTLVEVKGFFDETLKKCEFTQIGENLLKNMRNKVDTLIRSRLGHLSLYREMSSLSGGELQRLFLNSHLESKMNSLIYVLDEPSVGLHECEKSELFKSIKALRDLGNTVIVVEHDRGIIEMADYIIDIGPKAGTEGGQLMYHGDYAGLLECKDSITGQYMSGTKKMPERKKKIIQPDKWSKYLTVKHVKTNTLKDITVSFPIGGLIGVAGVSGCGKSSLVSDTLVPLLKNHFNHKADKAYQGDTADDMDDRAIQVESIVEGLEGIEHITDFAEVSQEPIGRNINSNPMTFLKLWDKVRKIFADQPQAKIMNLSAGHFSFNSEGACPACGGSGRKAIFPGISMKMYTVCDECKGKRFNKQALCVTYKGKNISEILEMQVSEAVTLFKEFPTIVSTLKFLDKIGMGYITLGQPTPTMSGGEAQRLKLAKEIGKKRKDNILYVLDEPTTGLSMYDTAKLISLLDELVKEGNHVIVIEHNLDLLNACDWIVELGPEGGLEGGRVIAEGSPESLKENPESITGKFL
jgi:excinuclease ABC subunit A